jgi:PhzF family phenazine biosynthesis protein
MRRRPFLQVDVFTDRAYLGNPLAVVLDGEGLSTDKMQHVAHWTNLSETAFLLPTTDQSADYRAHLPPPVELPFAGHPTLGSCRAGDVDEALVIRLAAILRIGRDEIVDSSEVWVGGSTVTCIRGEAEL